MSNQTMHFHDRIAIRKCYIYSLFQNRLFPIQTTTKAPLSNRPVQHHPQCLNNLISLFFDFFDLS